jgi:biotin transport system ATP-binding protein
VTPTAHVILEHVSFARGEQVALREVSLSLREQRVGLVGANGSGKSSLLRLLHGLSLPAEGRVTTIGIDTAQGQKLLPLRVGFLFQNPDRQIIFPTVAEEVAFGFEERGRSRREALVEAERWLERFGCADWGGRVVHDLSEGQKQLVCLIAVLALEPELVLLDEPFASLDLVTRLDFADRLRRLPQPLIMASHDLDFLKPFDRILWLDQGRVRADGPPADVLGAYVEHAHRGGEAAA